MQKRVASGLAIIGVAGALILPSANLAQGRSYRNEAPALTANQIVDRADARAAEFKARLRLTEAQAKQWPQFEAALHDIATKSANGGGDKQALNAGRSASDGTDRPDAARSERDMRRDDILAMQRDSDALATRSADLRKIADAARPFYDSLDDNQRRMFARFVHDDLGATESDASRIDRR
ncbi:Spy/CpxP family protein refolding chaperone [Methylocapsa acidiphila]|uniref:Spy/CpxP family protein refolding chaperone n=1 Tax=Methylocapsa acidiphila TaxID=133552 RepID=UPI000426541A|nr:Spy/CpxP family protein refolding chaperone [Methylocapsa acidiphila]